MEANEVEFPIEKATKHFYVNNSLIFIGEIDDGKDREPEEEI